MARKSSPGIEEAETGARRSVVFRALDVLSEVAEADRPISPSEIGRNLELPKATAHRLCAQLEREGYLAREPGGRQFRSGARFERLAQHVIRRSAIANERHAILEALVATIGETCNFTTLSGREVIYIDRVEARWPLRIHFEIGSRVPVHCTASGKLLLAHLEGEQRQTLLSSLELEALTPRTLITQRDLLRDLRELVRRGYSLDNEEFILGMTAIAAPVRDHSGRVICAVACHAPTVRLSVERAISHLPDLRRAAEKLSATLP